jgi:hypothetical protein
MFAEFFFKGRKREGLRKLWRRRSAEEEGGRQEANEVVLLRDLHEFPEVKSDVRETILFQTTSEADLHFAHSILSRL